MHKTNLYLKIQPSSYRTLDNWHENPNDEVGEDYKKLGSKWILDKRSMTI